ncbi:MAG: SufE family protein [Deltaproteobacteria bacterium]|nr:SufE family protein [Deltaproteobacteria bacterium]
MSDSTIPAAPPRLATLLSDLSMLEDRDERSDFLIETAARFRGVPESVAKRPYADSHRVPGCESEAFIYMQPLGDGALKFYFAVENPQGISAKALAVILDEVLSGCGPEQVLQIQEDLVHTIFGATVSMGKGQGLMGMIRMVKSLASASL